MTTENPIDRNLAVRLITEVERIFHDVFVGGTELKTYAQLSAEDVAKVHEQIDAHLAGVAVEPAHDAPIEHQVKHFILDGLIHNIAAFFSPAPKPEDAPETK